MSKLKDPFSRYKNSGEAWNDKDSGRPCDDANTCQLCDDEYKAICWWRREHQNEDAKASSPTLFFSETARVIISPQDLSQDPNTTHTQINPRCAALGPSATPKTSTSTNTTKHQMEVTPMYQTSKLQLLKWRAKNQIARIKERAQHLVKCHVTKPTMLFRLWLGSTDNRLEAGRVKVPYAPDGFVENLDQILFWMIDHQYHEEAETIDLYDYDVGYSWNTCTTAECLAMLGENVNYRQDWQICQDCNEPQHEYLIAEPIQDPTTKEESFEIVTGENLFWDFTKPKAHKALKAALRFGSKASPPHYKACLAVWTETLLTAKAPDTHPIAKTLRLLEVLGR